MNVQTPPARILLSRAERLTRKGDRVAAATLYQDVLDRYPSNRRARTGLARLAQEADQADARTLRPAVALFQSGRITEALELAERIARQGPGSIPLLELKAACLRRLSRPTEAIKCYDRALQTGDTASLWTGKGGALLEAGKLARAAAALGRATALAPDDPLAWMQLARCRLDMGQPTAALEAVETALIHAADARAGAVLRGRILIALGRTDQAERALRDALRGDAQDAPALNELAILARATGDRDGAVRQYDQALRLLPDAAAVHRNLSEVARYTPDAPQIATMLRLVTGPSLAPGDKAQLHFALFNAFDQLDETDRAFDHLQQGNALRKAQLHYDVGRDRQLMSWLASLRLPPAPMGQPRLRPIFVTGLPRSGTTLTEHVLARSPGVHPAGELPVVQTAIAPILRSLEAQMRSHLDPEEILALQTTLRQGLADYAGDHDVIIDKMPLNIRWAGFLRAALPEARIVVLHRDPMAVGWSLYRQYFGGGGNGFAYDLGDIARYQGLVRGMIAHFDAGPGDPLIHLDYADLTATPDETARRLRLACDLKEPEPHDAPVTRPILTASADQVRGPITAGRDNQWRRYETALSPLRDALKETGGFSNL
ncbi:tetratricopeptide repeat-containing sulfotransferase family protein [Sulfitobacter sabulilitoris]|nr:tetratricopeptide repeat-containing sulfotransferase family protein [Sulfitobacter sabulilitoris]